MDFVLQTPPHISKPHITSAKKQACKVRGLTVTLFPVCFCYGHVTYKTH